jgi:sialate O-acetylesterase
LTARGDVAATFELAGPDRKWVVATSVKIDGDCVLVQAAGVAAPVAGRFAWQNLPPGALCNRDGLPAAPFQCDLPKS